MRRTTLRLFPVLVCFLAVPGRAAEPERVLTGRTLTLNAPLSFTAGGGSYTLASGDLREFSERDEPAGWFFVGSGTMTWKAEDANAQKVYLENAGRIGGVSRKDGAVVVSFAEALFTFSEAGRPASPVLAPLPAGSAEAVAAFQRFAARFKDDRLPTPGTALLLARREKRAYFSALLAGGKDVRHDLDAATRDEETLQVVERPAGVPMDFPALRVSRTIGMRPIGRDRRSAPRADYVLADLSVDVREGATPRGAFVVEETLVPAVAASTFAFQLGSETLSPRAFTPQPTRFAGVTDESGRKLGWVYDNDLLLVLLPQPAPAGQPVKLAFSYDAAFFDREGGDNYWELGLGAGWYPQPLEWGAQSRHPFRATVRARKPLVPFATGSTVRRAEDGEWNLVETRMDRAVPFAMVVAGKYTIQEDARDGVTCRVASYGVSKEKSGAKLANLFHHFRKFYEEYLGPFPYKEYDIVEVNTYGFGQAPPGMMRITREAFQMNVLGDTVAELFSQGVNERIAHEVAHSYWGGAVWAANRSDQWLEESFAEISAGRALEVLKDKSDYKQLVNVWRSRGKDSASSAPIPLANELSAKASPGAADTIRLDRRNLVYFKGATLLVALRKELGDDLFFTVLKSFVRSFEKRPAVTTKSFIGLLDYVTKKEWTPWFEKYYWGYEVP